MSPIRLALPVALLLWLAAAPAPAAELPRVFYTPAERAAISARRRAAVPPGETTASASLAAAHDVGAAGAASTATTASAAAPGPRVVRLEGVTRGEGARAAAWIGGQRIEDGGKWGGLRLHVARNGVRLVAANGTSRFVRVGAEIDR